MTHLQEETIPESILKKMNDRIKEVKIYDWKLA